jgi:S1-C subfamily serine protease
MFRRFFEMKTMKYLIPVAAVLLLAGQAAAQSEEQQRDEKLRAVAEQEREAAEVLRETAAREAEVARKLEQAERTMAEAARQIAELTSERLPQLREIERRIQFVGGNKPRLGINIGGEETDGPVEGVLVLGVTPGSAAEDAGLRAGDIITSINNESLSADDPEAATQRILDFMSGVEEGDILDVEYLRDGKVGMVEVEPHPVHEQVFAFRGFPEDFSMPDIHVAPKVVQEFGNKFAFSWTSNVWSDMELVELNEGLGKYFGADSGVLVVSAPESQALQLEDGDVIRKIDGREPTSVRHVLRILSSYQAGESLQIEVLREKKRRTLEIEVPDDRTGMRFEAPMPVQPASAPRPARAPSPASEKT